jgi:membrane associated rhomboid family serine protease
MDWSLVLASQGIEHRIEHDEAGGWTLRVAATDHAAALGQIQQYRLENRHWRWRQPVWSSGLFFDWSCLLWVMLAGLFYYGSVTQTGLQSAGEMQGTALARGEWWRLFTAMWLHANLSHLALNLVFGFLFLGMAMGRYGPGMGLLAAYLAGAIGNIASGWGHGPLMRGLGASGMVMGALGLITFPARNRGSSQTAKVFQLLGSGVLAGILLFVLTGTNPEADVVAHLGGFVSGCLFGALLGIRPRRTRPVWANAAAGFIFVVLIILPWWLAWR